jgi:PAS domain S-box-containing protein
MMTRPIRLLVLEDNSADAELMLRELKRESLDVTGYRVETEPEFRRHLAERPVDVILADYSLPAFDGEAALRIAREIAPEVPFIFVSGSIGEERAVIALRNGATDYILKDRMSRLAPAVKRALDDRKELKLRRAAQEALRVSTERFEYATKATSDALWDWDLATGRVWVSEAMLALTGDSPDDQHDIQWLIRRTIHAGDAQRVESSLLMAIARRELRWSDEYRITRPGGTSTYVAGRAYIIQNESGVAVRVVGSVSDVSERRQAEEAHLAAAASLREAQRLALVGSWQYDNATGAMIWSEEAYRILGFNAEVKPSVGRYLSAIHPDDQQIVSALLQSQQRTGTPETLSYQHRLMRPDGSERTVECRSRVLVDDQGVASSAIGTIQDITERTLATRTIAHLSQRNQTILDCAAEGIIGIRADATISFTNPAASASLGWSREELLACADAHALFHHTKHDGTPNPPSESPILLTIRDGRKRAIKSDFFWRADGGLFAVEYEVAPMIENGEQVGCVLTFRDVTESHAMARQLELAKRIGSLGRVAATIAHEFNNVMMGIEPFAELIRRRAKEDQNIMKSAEQISISVRRGRRVTEEILRFTQPSRPDLLSIDLGNWLRALEPELRALAAPDVGVTVAVPDQPLYSACDAAQLQQVMTNLLVNARDASPPGGIVRVVLTPHADSSLQIVVRDTGPGIPAGALESIFEPLFTTKRTGTGLGLAVARQVLLQHGGSIEVSNHPGGGAEFRIVLPASEPPTVADTVQKTHPNANVSFRKLLLVEDDELVSAGLAALLESEGLEVRVVDRGNAVVAEIERFDPDAVILDLTLPDIDGRQVFHLLRERWLSLPVIFSTGQGGTTELASILESPHVGLLRKPYELNELLDAVERIAGREPTCT